MPVRTYAIEIKDNHQIVDLGAPRSSRGGGTTFPAPEYAPTQRISLSNHEVG